jgi:hypothetical protein
MQFNSRPGGWAPAGSVHMANELDEDGFWTLQVVVTNAMLNNMHRTLHDTPPGFVLQASARMSFFVYDIVVDGNRPTGARPTQMDPATFIGVGAMADEELMVGATPFIYGVAPGLLRLNAGVTVVAVSNPDGSISTIPNPMIEYLTPYGIVTMISNRVFAYFLDANLLEYDPETSTITLQAFDGEEWITVLMQVGSGTAIVMRGEAIVEVDISTVASGDARPAGSIYLVRYGSFTYLPARFLATIFGLDTQNMWDAETNTVTLEM